MAGIRNLNGLFLIVNLSAFFHIGAALLKISTPCTIPSRYITGINELGLVFPNSIHKYNINYECITYIVSNTQVTEVDISWLKMDMEPKDPVSNRCTQQYVQLFEADPDTREATKQLTEQLCGSGIPANITTTAVFLLIKIKTGNYISQTTGFVMKYKKKSGAYVAPVPIPPEEFSNWNIVLGVVIGFLFLLLLIFLLCCIRCCYYHREDLCRRRKKLDNHPRPTYRPNPNQEWVHLPLYVAKLPRVRGGLPRTPYRPGFVQRM